MNFLAQDIPEDLNLENLEDIDNPTLIEQFIAEFDWNEIIQQVAIAGIRIIFTIIVFTILHQVAKRIIRLFFRRYFNNSKNDSLSNRYETVLRVTKNIYHTVFIFFLAYTILEILNFPVGTLLASAGIVGLTVSFGAQGFVSDVVNGITILSQKQMDIGDEVRIEEISVAGTVLNINLRTTEIKAFDGTIHYVPNREILVLSNRSKGDMRALIDVRLFPETDINRVRDIIENLNEELIPQFKDITVPPNDILFVSNEKNQLTLRVILYTKPGSQYNVMNKFYEAYVRRLTNEGIDLPYGNIDLSEE